ncbi:MAG: hypothetical protein ABR567_14410 [Myxococcales bacterium]
MLALLILALAYPPAARGDDARTPYRWMEDLDSPQVKQWVEAENKPSHSFKYTAALQAAHQCDKPVLIRIEVAGSHGYRPTDRNIAEIADQYAFALANL